MLAASLVAVLHALFLAWVLLAPWLPQWEMVVLHALVMPFLMLHWLLNDDTCFLTWLECRLRGVPTSGSFVHSIVSPVYRLSETQASGLAWGLGLVLWGISLHRLYARHRHELAAAWPTAQKRIWAVGTGTR